MNWKTLCDILRTAATSGKKLDAFVTFTEDSFDKPYTKRERTYLLSSDNKAFRPAGGYSIFWELPGRYGCWRSAGKLYEGGKRRQRRLEGRKLRPG